MAWQNRFFLARLPSKNKTMREGTVNKERQEGKCDRPGHCGIENSSWEGRENRGPGGREGDTGTDRNIDEGGKDENDGEGERKTGERRRETEKREEKVPPRKSPPNLKFRRPFSESSDLDPVSRHYI